MAVAAARTALGCVALVFLVLLIACTPEPEIISTTLPSKARQPAQGAPKLLVARFDDQSGAQLRGVVLLANGQDETVLAAALDRLPALALVLSIHLTGDCPVAGDGDITPLEIRPTASGQWKRAVPLSDYTPLDEFGSAVVTVTASSEDRLLACAPLKASAR